MDTRSDPHRDKFKQTEKLCKKAVRAAKKKFENSIAKNGNRRPFNSYIKSKTKCRDNVGPLKVGNTYITDNDQMATLLNTTFSSVFTVEDPSNIPTCQSLSGNLEICNIQFTPENVTANIKKLNFSSSSGPDGLSSRFLNDNVNSLSVPLAILYKSFQSEVVPVDWRTAYVTPIFKKGTKSDPENYCPISLNLRQTAPVLLTY